MNFAAPDALLERLLTAEREIVFLVGAPLTAPTGSSPLGVPGVRGMVESIQAFLRRGRSRSLEVLAERLRDAPNPYQVAFQHLSDHRGVDAANAIIQEAVLQARLPRARPAEHEGAHPELCDRLENDLDGWHYPPAVEALGRIAARFSPRLGRTLLTTNFDPLIELSIRRAGGRAYSRMQAGDFSLEDVRGEGSYVVHLHGYWHGTDTLHTPLSLGQERPMLRASLKRVLRARTVVVMAYGGWQDVFTQALKEVCADPGERPDVLWCFYEKDPWAIQRSQAALLEELQPAIARHRVTFYTGVDCHAFLPRLLEELARESGGVGLSSPGEAPVRDDAGFFRRPRLQDALREIIERGQAAQLVGPRLMGKSSLLHWLERTVRANGAPVAFVNARGLEGRSPVELVRAAGKVLGRADEVRRALYAESAVPDTRAAERAIQQLAPLCLLVDEADALAEEGHAFDRGFFETLRALGQERRLTWVSASQVDLFELYRGTGLTSAFLNDARRIHVGVLSPGEVRHWLRERGLEDPALAGALTELVGGVPPALVWLAVRLVRAREEPAVLERELRRWLEPLFRLWWQRLEPAARDFLKRCTGEGVEVEALPEQGRRGGRALVSEGFLLEAEGRFRLWGRAWHDFVRDAS